MLHSTYGCPGSCHVALLTAGTGVGLDAADEHYFPTLLAHLGLENEAYCDGYGLAAVNWTAGGAHPRSFT